MLQQDLLHIQRTLQTHKILISFSGKLSQDLIEQYGEAVKRYLETEDFPRTEVFHTFSVFIEQTQNIKNYCGTKTDSPYTDRILTSSIVTIGRTEHNGTFVCSGNLIEKQDAPALLARLENIIALDKNGLKQLYKETLKRELPEGSTGAGLGLIDIARKASLPLEYCMTDIDEELSFFTLKAVI